ncbi:MAG: flagellar basal body rod protein FlgF [Succinivibrio sp.]|nr:flagellar basal body rod protein FlgF [Succinivibrio sp.]
MDKLLWISMSGAKENFHSLGVRSNNLANANTTGFKADFEQSRSMSVFADAYPSRAFAMTERPGFNMDDGPIQTTDRALDIAVRGEGMIAVTDKQGNEAYTRFGNLRLDSDGVLRTGTGLDVLDEDGAQIVLPALVEDLHISDDGVISGRPQGADSNVLEEYQRIKLVRPDIKAIEKGYDGLFRRIDGNPMEFDENVRVRSGILEASNVNPVAELTNLIRIQRQYDVQVKMMETAKEIDQSQSNLMTYDGM